MFGMLKDLVSQRVQLKLLMQGPAIQQSAMQLQSLIASYNINGTMLVGKSVIEITAEGPRSRLESVMKAVLRAPFMPTSMQTRTKWSEFEGRFEGFRVGFGTVNF
jgi:predicted sulfurtransferase